MSRNNEMQSDKVNIVASVITVSRMYFACNKRTRHEMRIDLFSCGTYIWPQTDFRWRFIWHITRRQILGFGRRFCTLPPRCRVQM